MLSENRRRIANETVAPPNVVIYQQFRIIKNKPKRSSGTRANQTMGLKEMMKKRKKNSPKNKLFSSIGSGPIEGR